MSHDRLSTLNTPVTRWPRYAGEGRPADLIVRRELRRPKLLISAFMCSPSHGSEWANGWNRALECARLHDTWVICQGDHQRQEIEQYLAQHGPITGLTFEFLDFGPALAPAQHVTGLLWLRYNRWHRRAAEIGRRLHAEHHFDMVHQLTNSSFREPGYLWQLDVPFIWGPLGGTHNLPWRFLGELGWRDGLSEGVRSVLNYVQLNWSQRPRRAARRASTVLVANTAMQAQVRRAYKVECVPLLDVGIKSIGQQKPTRDLEPNTLRIIWSGQCAPRKGLSLLLRALAALPAEAPFELRVVGGGPLEAQWKELALRLGVADRVEWLGWIPHQEALKQYEWANLFAFTSLRDNSGTVILEAMANGLPVVCLGHQGARDIVTDACGVQLAVTSPRQVVEDLRLALVHLSKNRELRERMSEAARERAADYLWTTLAKDLNDVYRRALQASEPARPHDAVWAESRSIAALRGQRLDRETVAATSENGAESAVGNVLTFPRSRLRDSITWGAQRAAAMLHKVRGDRRDAGFGILMYHRVAEHTHGFSAPTSNVTPQRLRIQLEGLMAMGFKPWSVPDLLAAQAAGKAIDLKAFAVTFDDGYENNLLAALPVLEDLNVPASVFVATSFLDSDRPFPFDNWDGAGSSRVPPESWRALTTGQCHELAAHPLVDVGAHTHTHGAFAERVEDFRQDLQQSLEVLDGEFGITQPTFAFPFGMTNPAMMEIARQCGVKCALTTVSRNVQPGEDAFGWGRYSADDRDTVATLAAKLSGWYTPVADALRPLKKQMARVAPATIGEMVELPARDLAEREIAAASR